MASLIQETSIDASPDHVWDALRDFGALHRRLVPGFVTDAVTDGDVRTVTFFNGGVAKEHLVGIDDQARRLAYSIIESGVGLTCHMASAQVLDAGDGTSRFVWTADFLPDAVAPTVDALMAKGLSVIKQHLEEQAAR